jgi:hypothetical protein
MRKLILLIAIVILLNNQSLFSQVPSYVPTTGLVAYWPFSGNANDASGNGNNGTVNGATLTTDRNGAANNAYSFNGTSDFISLVSYNFFSGNSSRSISFWIQTNQTQNGIPFSIGNASFNSCFNVRFGAGAPGIVGVMGFSNDFYPTSGSSSSIINNIWHNVVITFNGTTLKIFVDGVLDNSVNKSYNTSGTDNYIGKSNQSGGESWVSGKIDDIGIWNRALTAQEITNLYVFCNTSTPTGSVSQVFCASNVPTVSNLTATGTGIQWYASATGGTALATTTALVSGTTYYASQTVSACESTTRLAVTVTLNDTQITASATIVCSGTPITLTASTTGTVAQYCNLPTSLQTGLVGYWPFCGNANDVSGNGINGTVNGATLTTDRFGNANSAYNFDGVNDNISIANNGNTITNKTFSAWVLLNSLSQSGGGLVSILKNSGANFDAIVYNEWNSGWMFGSDDSNRSSTSNFSETNIQWVNITCTYSANQYRMYRNGVMIHESLIYNIEPFTNGSFLFGQRHFGPANAFLNAKIDDVAIYNRTLSAAEILQLYNSGQTTYLWSTGATTASINPSPTATTTYWCDVTVNGVTCRKSVTVTVNTIPEAPTGTATQTFCATPAPTVASLTATGTGIQWYTSAT